MGVQTFAIFHGGYGDISSNISKIINYHIVHECTSSSPSTRVDSLKKVTLAI